MCRAKQSNENPRAPATLTPHHSTMIRSSEGDRFDENIQEMTEMVEKLTD